MENKVVKKQLYDRWWHMMQRCYYPKNNRFHKYFLRGIKVCQRWKNFLNFYRDMVDGYRPELSLDRIDNNKGYFPSNCKWSTRSQQANNRTTSRKLTYKGETKTIMEWSLITGIKYTTIHNRLNYYGWKISEALETKNVRR